MKKQGLSRKGFRLFYDGSRAEATEVIRTTGGENARHLVEKSRKMRSKFLKLRETILHFQGEMRMIKMLSGRFTICGCYQANECACLRWKPLGCLLGNCESESGRKEEVALMPSHPVTGKGVWKKYCRSMCYVDGAHNAGCDRSVCGEYTPFVSREPEPLPIVVFSAVADKDYE